MSEHSEGPVDGRIDAEQVSRRHLLAAAAAVPALMAAGVQGARAQTTARSGKVAIVTGSTRGIGAAIARRLARDGYAVTINGVANRDLAEKLARQIEATGGRAIFDIADVSDPAAVRGLFDVTERAIGGVDVVVSNAGIMRLAPFRDMTDQDFDRMIAVNVKGSFNVLREAARRVRDHGRIIALSSSITQFRSPTYGPYAASKGAQDMYVGSLAKELAGRMISVNAIAPGVVNTPLFTDGKSPQEIAGFVQRTPHKRLGEPDDIARVVSNLCNEDGWWVSGQTIFANGGIV